MRRAAIIDVGSNSIRYACGGVEGGQALLEPKRVAATRLAEGLSQSGRLGEIPMQRSLRALAEFAADANKRGLPVYAYATSAVRDSGNQEDFCRQVEALGIELTVLSGEEEARLALLGAAGGKGGLMDIGGGSTQLIRRGFIHSAPIGCVRARELCAGAGNLAQMKGLVYARCQELLRFPAEKSQDYVGVGGTITTIAALMLGLAAYDGEKVRAMPICHTALDELVGWLYDIGEAGRRAHPLLADRADTILPGALILTFLLARTGVGELRVSDRDGMEGYLLHRLGGGPPG